MTMALVAAGIGAVGAMGAASMSGGGGGSSESATTPFFAGIPGLVQNANRAAELQAGYNVEPFNPQQLAAINNLYGQSDYMRQLVPGLLQQMQGQQVGFDRNNPMNRPQAWNFGLLANAPAGAGGEQMQQAPQGLLASPSIGESLGSAVGLLGQTGVRNTAPGIGAQDHRPVSERPVAAPAPTQEAAGPLSQAFRQAHLPPGWAEATNTTYKALGGNLGDEQTAAMNAGYGGFQYGMDMRKIAADPRLEADARMYFAMGGNDPFDVYSGQYMAADRYRALQDQMAADRQANQY